MTPEWLESLPPLAVCLAQARAQAVAVTQSLAVPEQQSLGEAHELLAQGVEQGHATVVHQALAHGARMSWPLMPFFYNGESDVLPALVWWLRAGQVPTPAMLAHCAPLTSASLPPASPFPDGHSALAESDPVNHWQLWLSQALVEDAAVTVEGIQAVVAYAGAAVSEAMLAQTIGRPFAAKAALLRQWFDAGANPNHPGAKGDSLLLHAIRRGDARWVEAALAQRTHPIQWVMPATGRSVLHAWVDAQWEPGVRSLQLPEQAKAWALHASLHAPNAAGQTPSAYLRHRLNQNGGHGVPALQKTLAEQADHWDAHALSQTLLHAIDAPAPSARRPRL